MAVFCFFLNNCFLLFRHAVYNSLISLTFSDYLMLNNDI